VKFESFWWLNSANTGMVTGRQDASQHHSKELVWQASCLLKLDTVFRQNPEEREITIPLKNGVQKALNILGERFFALDSGPDKCGA